MLDPKLITQEPDLVISRLNKRGRDYTNDVQKAAAADEYQQLLARRAELQNKQLENDYQSIDDIDARLKELAEV